ncbi:MAG: tyrosine-type recombinase/integrase, partial [Pseudomonadota bacterium]|nr:tyrosine-type recombinase/integrase [Pseudomonadota bacterium]
MSNKIQFSATPDLQKQCGMWLESLAVENRLSPHTLTSYSRDLTQFLDFLAEHYARPPALADMSSLQLADLRAFLAARRHNGAQSRSLNRSVSGLRNFARFLERRNTPVSPAFNLLSVPKPTRSLPRPVAQNDALAMIRLALESASAVWVGRRDAALLCLLYGAGLRVSEALQLDVKSLPPTQDRALRILGKGNKERQVPLLPIIRQTLDDYIRAAPFGFAPEDPVFRGIRGGRLSARQTQMMVAGLRRTLGLAGTVTPHALRH